MQVRHGRRGSCRIQLTEIKNSDPTTHSRNVAANKVGKRFLGATWDRALDLLNPTPYSKKRQENFGLFCQIFNFLFHKSSARGQLGAACPLYPHLSQITIKVYSSPFVPTSIVMKMLPHLQAVSSLFMNHPAAH